MTTFPEPGSTGDLRGLLLRYLDFYRDAVADKVAGLAERDVRASRVPSGWSPGALINHLVFMERRWLQWGFCGDPVPDPWGDAEGGREDGRWIDPGLGADALRARLADVGARTRAIVEAHGLTDAARTGGRFAAGAATPQLQWILLHVLQEYARHAGHLDVARELVDGVTGEGGDTGEQSPDS